MDKIYKIQKNIKETIFKSPIISSTYDKHS